MAGWMSKAAAYEQIMADPIDRLVRDHRKLMNLLQKLNLDDEMEAELSPDQILRELEEELEMHSKLEEALFFPAFADSDAAGQRTFAEHQREHEEVAAVVESLKDIDPKSPQFATRARELESYIADHASQEEESIFPQLRQLLSEEQLEALGLEALWGAEND